VTEIDWDIDDDDDAPDLPADITWETDDDTEEDDVVDELSEEYGWSINECLVEEITVQGETVNGGAARDGSA
jgi:hypothetical protein